MPLQPGEPVSPCMPVAPYIGGKRNLAKRLVPLIDALPCQTYAEPFVGLGGIFLRRTRRPQAEVINDLSADVSGLFRVLQRHYQAFLDMIRWQITTRSEFERLVKLDPDSLTDLERAARFLYLQRTAYGGKVNGRNFGVSVGRPGTFDITKLVPLLEALHERLAGVVIERLPYDAFLTRYDRPGTLFYLDPPYAGGEQDYGRRLFQPADFERLADQLASLAGRFILSINDRPEMRQVFGRFEILEVQTSYSLNHVKKGQTAAELIVTGPDTWRRELGL
ncbi:DNA adenine methylase [Algihabitans albus]|uniref:DNA adenine methylase n=1 Tax=Algihabitans albus TaxID=2164067 RepID=UPI002E262033